MSLVVWLPLNGNLENKGTSDLQFTAISTNTSINASGKIGQCYSNNSFSAGGLCSNATINLGQHQSMFCWFKFTSLNSSSSLGAGLVSQHRYSSNTGMGITIRYASSTTGYLSVNTGTGSSRTYNTYYGTTLLQANTWYHGGYTYDGSTIKIYVNGNCEKTQAYSNMSVPADYITAFCWSMSGTSGSTVHGDYKLNGLLNDVRIYDECLSPLQVHELAQGLVLHYSFNNFNNTLLPLGYEQLSYIESTGASYINTTYKFNPETDSCKVIFQGNDKTNNGMIFASNGGKYFWFYYYSSNGIRLYAHNGSGQQGISGITSDLNKHTMEYKNKHYFIDNVDKGSLSNTYSEEPNPIYLFSYGGANYVFKGKIYYVEIYRNNVLQRIFIPAKQLNNSIAGMYELVNKIFYPSNSTTAFTAGSVLSTPNQIPDNTGYSNYGIINGNISSAEASIRNSTCIYIPSGNTDYITTSKEVGNFSNGITMSIWFKSANKSPGNGYHEIFNIATATQNFEFAIYQSGFFRGGMVINGTRYVDNTNNTNLTDGNWHMLTMTYDGAVLRRYVDGIDKKDTTISGTLTSTSCQFLFGHYGNNTSYYAKEAYLNDARIYCTALSAADIKNLYETSMFIDNNSNVLPFELSENNSNYIEKTGTLNDDIIEPFITLSDGSNWQLLLFHKVDNGTRLFTSSNATYCNNYGLFSRLAYINNFTYNNKYEFYVIQDGKEFRWTQTSQPTASSIAGKTVISGYLDPVNGLAKASQSNTYIGYNAWWGACGCWTQYSTGGKTGIPGFGSHDVNGMCTDYLALYARIEKPHVFKENNSIQANEFIER